MRSRALVAVLGLVLTFPVAVGAQEAAGTSQHSEVMGSGSVEVLVPPTKATILLTLSGEGMDARGARLALDSIRTAVEAALTRLGLSAQPWGIGLGENQQIRRMLAQSQDTRTSRDMLMRVGLAIEVPNPSKVPEVLDALFAAGVKGPLNAFFGAGEDDARVQAAVTRATAMARRDAERLAAASGGHLGQLRQISRTPSFGQSVLNRGGYMMDMSGVAVPPGDISVIVHVQGTWEYLGN